MIRVSPVGKPSDPARADNGKRRRCRMLFDRRGVAAVEFSLIMPLMLIAYLGGFAICEACAMYRKLADATVETANVTAQYASMQSADAQTVMGDTAQIMAPYANNNLSMVLSLIQTNNANPVVATVQWSQGYQGGICKPANTVVTLPAGLAQPNSTYILVTAAYNYVPLFGTSYIPSIPLTDSIYVMPRQSTSIPCTTCTCTTPG